MILTFSAWRSAIVYRFKLINPLQYVERERQNNSNLNTTDMSKARNKSMFRNSRASRPFITKNVGTSLNQLPLRYIETSDLSV